MPGIGLEMDGAIQQAPHLARHSKERGLAIRNTLLITFDIGALIERPCPSSSQHTADCKKLEARIQKYQFGNYTGRRVNIGEHRPARATAYPAQITG
jgi:hypothetical protein